MSGSRYKCEKRQAAAINKYLTKIMQGKHGKMKMEINAGQNGNQSDLFSIIIIRVSNNCMVGWIDEGWRSDP